MADQASFEGFLLESSAQLLQQNMGPELFENLLVKASASLSGTTAVALARQDDGYYRAVATLDLDLARFSNLSLAEDTIYDLEGYTLLENQGACVGILSQVLCEAWV